MRRSRQQAVWVGGLVALVGVGGVGSWWATAPGGRDSVAPWRPTYTIEGLSYLEQGTGLALEIEVGKVDLRRPGFGFFSVGPRNDLLFRDLRARVEVLDPDAARDGLALDSVRRGILGMMPSLESGAIRSTTIETLRIQLVDARSGDLVLSAAAASLVEGQRFRLSGGLSVMTSGGQRLHAREAEWRWGSRKLSVRGPYTLLDGPTRTQGADSRIGFDSQGRVVVRDR